MKLSWAKLAKMVAKECDTEQSQIEDALRGFKRLTDIDPGGRGLDVMNAFHDLETQDETQLTNKERK